jgi:multiple sugar transport system substrate-binding protein
MKEKPGTKGTKGKLTRRDFLKAGTAGLGVAVLGGVFPGKAPAYNKGTTLSILYGTFYIAPAQVLMKQQVEEWGKMAGVKASIDFMSWANLQAKVGATIQAGGMDITELQWYWNFLYKDNMVDMTEEAEAVGKAGGGFEKYALESGLVDGRWYGIPTGTSTSSICYRISKFKEAGIENAEDGNKLDMTWDEYFAVAKKLKAKGMPFGQALGHSTGDPVAFSYPYMWSNGGMEVAEDGKTVKFNTPQFVEAVHKFIQAWKDGYDVTGTSWDDSNNNRAYLSGQISSTLNGSSIYFAAKKDKPEIAEDTNHMLIPKGVAGHFYRLGTRHMGIFKKSKNIEAAKDFMKWWFQDAQYGKWFRIQQGYHLQAVKKWADDPMWFEDPKMSVYRNVGKYGRSIGYAGPPTRKAAMAQAKYIIVDTLAKAVQSGDAKGSVKWGADQLERVYGR